MKVISPRLYGKNDFVEKERIFKADVMFRKGNERQFPFQVNRTV